MAERLPVGAVLGSAVHPAGLAELSAHCEGLGFSEIWLAEDYFFTGGVAGAASVLAATDEVPVGLGIVSAMVRHPALLAKEMSTLAHLHPGRVWPGVGLGLPPWLRQMGLYPKSQLRAVRECVTSMRSLLAGDEVTDAGDYFSFDAVKLTYPAPGLPIYLGVLGPKMLRLSGEIADGTTGSAMASTAYIRWARERIDEGRQEAGRTDHHAFRSIAMFACDADSTRAKSVVRGILGFYLAAAGHTALTDVYGVHDELDALLPGGPDQVAAEMPDEWVEDLVIAGDPEECAAKIQAQLAAGADSVSLFPVPPDEAAAQFELAAREVFPRLSPVTA